MYNQELLEYIAQESAFRQSIVDSLPPAAAEWMKERLRALLGEHDLKPHHSVIEMSRIVLALGAQGNVVLIGRGANCILPAESTLLVRIMAPLAERIAYMSQWLRLTLEQAAAQVELRDRRRADFLDTHFHRQPGDIYQYDLVLNSSLLGEELCAELIAQAARAKADARQAAHRPATSWTPERLT